MRVAALQFDVRTAEVAANLQAVERGLERAAREGIELVALPEMWPTSFADETDADLRAASHAALERVRTLSGELSLVVVGSAWGGAGTAPPPNRLHVFANGELVAAYDKVHLFSPTAEPASFSAGGTPPPTVRTACGLVSGVVCYDLRFPELLRIPFRAGAELLVVVAQWPLTRAAHWRALVIGRAVEAQCFVVAANRTGRATVGRRGLELEFPGNSLVVDPNGTVLAEGHGRAELVTASVDREVARRMRRAVPVGQDDRPDLYRLW